MAVTHWDAATNARGRHIRMPLQNRVTPFGEIVAFPERGLLLGNRGVLHNDRQQIVRSWQIRRWIACQLQFRGRHRVVMQPHTWTELFFLDEATAFAAGHRPCAECRHADYRRFKTAWAAWSGASASADEMDIVLHGDRLDEQEKPRSRQRKRTYRDEITTLPDGAFVRLAGDDGTAWLRWRGHLLAWSAAGYHSRRALPRSGLVEVLTPRALVEVLRAGYHVDVHPSASHKR